MKEIVIVSAVRTAVGSYGGSLSNVPAAELGAIVIKEALNRIHLSADLVNEVYMGCILQAGQGQGVARQASILAGLPVSVPATTVNMLCGSGLRTVSLAAQTILSGDNEIVVVGGMENMSMAPYLMDQARFGYRMGDGKIVDSMIKDALTDAFNNYHMGITAENLAEKYHITREEQDIFATLSQNNAERAQREGLFQKEIVPVSIKQRKGDPIIFDTDEFVKSSITTEKLSKLKPAFKKDGTVTAGNASGINDGAAALVVMSADKAKSLGLKPLATIISFANAGVDPSIMGIGPVPASRLALEKANLSIHDMDLIEANEAFAAQALAVGKELQWDPSKVNVNGGAIAIGHPVGASGARILVTLLHELERREGKYGLATLCIGGGMGTALIIKRTM